MAKTRDSLQFVHFCRGARVCSRTLSNCFQIALKLLFQCLVIETATKSYEISMATLDWFGNWFKMVQSWLMQLLRKCPQTALKLLCKAPRKDVQLLCHRFENTPKLLWNGSDHISIVINSPAPFVEKTALKLLCLLHSYRFAKGATAPKLLWNRSEIAREQSTRENRPEPPCPPPTSPNLLLLLLPLSPSPPPCRWQLSVWVGRQQLEYFFHFLSYRFLGGFFQSVRQSRRSG